MRRLPLLVMAVLAVGYAGAAYFLLLPPIPFTPRRALADLPPADCGSASFLAEIRRESEILFVPLAQIPEQVQTRVLQQEDRSFYRHRGINWPILWRALVRDLAAGEVKFGASTLTMQLARELYLDKRRRVVRKLREMAYAVQLERRLSKEQILELYLNVVDWGPGLRGIGAASCYYFGVPPSALDAEQSARLVALLPSPERLGAILEQELRSTPTPATTGA